MNSLEDKHLHTFLGAPHHIDCEVNLYYISSKRKVHTSLYRTVNVPVMTFLWLGIIKKVFV